MPIAATRFEGTCLLSQHQSKCCFNTFGEKGTAGPPPGLDLERYVSVSCFPFAFSTKAEKPDCSERLQLQKRLGCKNFQWFLSNVYPELSQTEDTPRFSGKLYNTGVGFCADYRPGRATADGSIELSPCSDSPSQVPYTSSIWVLHRI